MSEPPPILANDRTGETIEYISDTPEALVWMAHWPRPGRRNAPHRHPRMEERWTVLEGRASFLVDTDQVEAGPGDHVVAPAGSLHCAWNPGPDPARVRVEMRPALRWREFTTRLFAGEDPVALSTDYPDEVSR